MGNYKIKGNKGSFIRSTLKIELGNVISGESYAFTSIEATQPITIITEKNGVKKQYDIIPTIDNSNNLILKAYEDGEHFEIGELLNACDLGYMDDGIDNIEFAESYDNVVIYGTYCFTHMLYSI